MEGQNGETCGVPSLQNKTLEQREETEMMNIKEVVDLMESSKSGEEWGANCYKIKAACGGYPSYWYKEILLSGLATRVTARFGDDADIHISVL